MSMRPGQDRIELLTLTLLNETSDPVGARRLAEVLRAEGFDLAEATAGRFLRSLDEAGATISIGKQGRVLTESGRQRMEKLRLRGELAAHGALVAAAAEAQDLEELTDLLHARRAVESEAVRLAVRRATEAEIAAIAQAALDHAGHVDAPDRIARAHAFHMLLVRASHNRMLTAIAGLLLDLRNEKLALLLDRLAEAAGMIGDLAQDNHEIVDALRARDADRAERAVRRHMDKLIAVPAGAPRKGGRRGRLPQARKGG
jgi:DNA-binding GntR family transcriptional regulator